MTIITTKNLSKTYGKELVVDSLCINVRRGEIYGFLGLNGAGKTTTIRMLLGMIKPDYGQAIILGKNISPSQGPWEKIGYMVETPGAYPNLTVIENLKIIALYRKLRKESIEETIINLRLEKYKNTLAKNLSLGNAQRLGLAKALIHNPEVLILDEPTNGLDPEGIHEIREMLKGLAANKKVTIIVSSHLLNEISKIATRVGILHQGKLLQEINTNDLMRVLKRKLVINTIDNNEAIKIFKNQNIPFQLSCEGHIEIVNTEVMSKPHVISTLLVQANCPPCSIFVEEEDLEKYFLRLIKL